MLTELLTLLSNPDTLSLAELARQAGYTPDETAAGLEQLARMGYIEKQEIGQACGVCSGGGHCDTCSVAGTTEPLPSYQSESISYGGISATSASAVAKGLAQAGFSLWHLTEKGNRYLSKRKRAER